MGIPMSMNQDQFEGRCLLFSTGQWREMDGQFVVQWASQAYCNFTIFVAVIMFVISVIQFARFVRFLRRGRDSSFFSAFVDVLVCVVMVIFVLIAGCFTSVGFKVWCDEMEQRFPTCSEAGGSNIDKADGIDSSGFFFQMSVANFGIWVSFTMWIILLTFSCFHLRTLSKILSTDNDVVDRNMDQFNKETNKSHDGESDSCGKSDIEILSCLAWCIV